MEVANIGEMEEQLAAAASAFTAGNGTPSLIKALSSAGFSTIAMAVGMLVYKPAHGALFEHHIFAAYYYLALVLIFVAGVVEIFVAFWVSDDQHGRRRAIGGAVLRASVVPLAAVVGLGGYAVLVMG